MFIYNKDIKRLLTNLTTGAKIKYVTYYIFGVGEFMNEVSKANFENEILFYVRRINNLMVTRINSAIKETALTVSQFEIFAYLDMHKRNNGAVTQRELEEFFGLSHPAVIGLLKQLKCKGLVEVTVNSKDRRQRNVVLTEKAELFKRNFKSNIGITDDILSVCLNNEQQEVLKSLLETMYKRLKEKFSET